MRTTSSSSLARVRKAGGDWVVGEAREDIRDKILRADEKEPAGNTVAIVGTMTPTRPGLYVLESMRLRFRVAGGPEQVGEDIDVTWTVWVDAGAACPT